MPRRPAATSAKAARERGGEAADRGRSRTATRRWSGPRPGNVSPRRTAMPAARSACAHLLAPAVGQAQQQERRASRQHRHPRAPRRAPPPARPAAARRPRAARSASATAAGAEHAITASSAGVDTGHGGRGTREPGQHVGRAERVARPQPGERPRLREAAEHEEARAVPPATDSGSPGTASANASSTSTHPPRARSARSAAAGCSTPVGLVGLPTTTRSASAGTALDPQPVPVGGVGEHPHDGYARRPQRRFRLGEPGVHDGGAAAAAAPAAARTPRRCPRGRAPRRGADRGARRRPPAPRRRGRRTGSGPDRPGWRPASRATRPEGPHPGR